MEDEDDDEQTPHEQVPEQADDIHHWNEGSLNSKGKSLETAKTQYDSLDDRNVWDGNIESSK